MKIDLVLKQVLPIETYLDMIIQGYEHGYEVGYFKFDLYA
jgi:hypothetical protein